MNSPAIGPDTFVTLSYVLFDEHGEAIERDSAGEPTTYVHGYAQIVPGLERQIEGMHAGDKRSVTVEAAEAFGDRDDEGVFEVDRAELGDSSSLTAGDVLEAEAPGGGTFELRVVEVRGGTVVVDTNHPLAGQRLRFEVEVASVRAATEEEIAAAQADLEDRIEDEDACGCGHDHGDEGHDHDHDGHDHGHDHAPEGPSLVQLSKKLVS